MSWKVVCAAFALLVSGCVTSDPDLAYQDQETYRSGFDSTDRGLTSRYFMAKGTGKFYHYGNFCGAGIPFAEKDPANLGKAAAVKPVDTIDRACKLHDMCYMKFGVDNLDCDGMISYFLGLTYFSNLGTPLSSQCHRLAGEIDIGIGNKGAGQMAATLTMSPLSAVDMLFFAPGGGGSRVNLGFPIEPGHCNASFGGAESYVGFVAYPIPAADYSRINLLAAQRTHEKFNIYQLHFEMVCLSMLARKSRANCNSVYGKYDEYYGLAAADVQLFLETGRIEPMPADRIKELLQPHMLMRN